MAKLKIYTDENVDVRVAEGLRLRGIKAFSAIEKAMIGATDQEHFKYALRNKAVIFTHDHHFLEIAKTPPLTYYSCYGRREEIIV